MVADVKVSLGELIRLYLRLAVIFHRFCSTSSPIDEIQDVFDGFALGAMLCASAVIPGMAAQNGGTIISVGSDAGKVGNPGETVIGAAMLLQ